MSEAEQIHQLYIEVDRVVERFKAEYNLSTASAIGVLEMMKLNLWKEQMDIKDDE